MLQRLRVKNFLSFRDEAELSFEATKDETLEDSHVVEPAPGVRLLRFMMVMGANASGKSNLLVAIEFLRTFWFAPKLSVDEPTGVQPFLLDSTSSQQCSEFEIVFWQNAKKYKYVLKLDTHKVHEETLYYYGSAQPTKVFHRTLVNGKSTIEFNPKTVKLSAVERAEIGLKCLRNVSFFAARNQVNVSIPLIDEVCEWMSGKITPMIEPNSQVYKYAKQQLKDNTNLRHYVLDYIQQADFNITGLKTLADTDLEFEHTITNANKVERYAIPEKLQSTGTIRTIGLEAMIYGALSANALLVIDELDASLHPDLLEFTIQRFLQEDSQSQMLVTTHYDPLLTTIDDLIRKDCVWFTEKDEAGNSSLYSLADFSNLGKMSSISIRNAYRHGQFGALPKI